MTKAEFEKVKVEDKRRIALFRDLSLVAQSP